MNRNLSAWFTGPFPFRFMVRGTTQKPLVQAVAFPIDLAFKPDFKDAETLQKLIGIYLPQKLGYLPQELGYLPQKLGVSSSKVGDIFPKSWEYPVPGNDHISDYQSAGTFESMMNSGFPIWWDMLLSSPNTFYFSIIEITTNTDSWRVHSLKLT